MTDTTDSTGNSSPSIAGAGISETEQTTNTNTNTNISPSDIILPPVESHGSSSNSMIQKSHAYCHDVIVAEKKEEHHKISITPCCDLFDEKKTDDVSDSGWSMSGAGDISGEGSADMMVEASDLNLNTRPAASLASTSSFFCYICYSERTAEDLAEEGEECVQLTACGHRYCLGCLQAYLESNIVEGKTQLRCCCLADEEEGEEVEEKGGDCGGDRHDETNSSSVTADQTSSQSQSQSQGKSKVQFCGAVIAMMEVADILVNKPVILQKYTRFKFLKEKPHGRECPQCGHLQLHRPHPLHPDPDEEDKEEEEREKGEGDAVSEPVALSISHVLSAVSTGLEPPTPTLPPPPPPPPLLSPVHKEAHCHPNAMICELPECGTAYCFQHALAHPPTVSCEDYELSIASSVQASREAILLISKPCPGCGIYVSKTDGCNHMKCTNCQQCFCWVCGVAVEDAVFPSHFQWWNAMGCANMQMAEEIVPTRSSILFARATAVAQTVLLGPISVASTLVSFILCFPCLYSYHTVVSPTAAATAAAASSAVSSAASATSSTAAPQRFVEVEAPVVSSDTTESDSNGTSTTTAAAATTTTTSTSARLVTPPPTATSATQPLHIRRPFPWSETIQGCVSGWGFFYLCVLVVLPLAVLVGGCIMVYWLIHLLGNIVTYPFHYYAKKKKGETPKSFFSFFEMRRRPDLINLPSGPLPPTPSSPVALSPAASKGIISTDPVPPGLTSTSTSDAADVRKYQAINLEEENELRKLEEGLSSLKLSTEDNEDNEDNEEQERSPSPPDQEGGESSNSNSSRSRSNRKHYSGRFDLSGSHSSRSLLKTSSPFGGVQQQFTSRVPSIEDKISGNNHHAYAGMNEEANVDDDQQQQQQQQQSDSEVSLQESGAVGEERV